MFRTIVLTLSLAALTACGINLYKGVEKKDESSVEEANTSLQNGDGNKAEQILMSLLTKEETEIIKTVDPLDETFAQTFVASTKTPANPAVLTMLANALGAKHGVDFLTLAARVSATEKTSGSDRDNILSLFPLMPKTNIKALRDLDVGISLLNVVKTNSKDKKLDMQQAIVQSVLALTSFAGSLRNADRDDDNRLSVREISALSDYDANLLYIRLYRTKAVMENLMAISANKKLEKPYQKILSYIERLESIDVSVSPNATTTQINAAKVRALLMHYQADQ